MLKLATFKTIGRDDRCVYQDLQDYGVHPDFIY